jgi:hypothetical protein
MTFEDKEELKYAKYLLENDGLANKMTKYLNKPIEKGLELLPKDIMDKVQMYTNTALQKALSFAISSISNKEISKPNNKSHKLAVTITGGIGGFFGISSALVELPVSTTLMLRSIAEIAASYGEDLDDIYSRLACLEVLALGSTGARSSNPDVSYFGLRVLLAREISEAAKYIAQKGIIEEGAPILIKLINSISTRFGVSVSQKLAGQALPIIGSISGAAINNIFIDHFQKTAKAHFTIRRLERKYGNELIQQTYQLV